jgi:DNA helicase-2/ATP-dependent DNA helicase PcrA
VRRTLLKVLKASNQYRDNLFEWLKFVLTELDLLKVFDGSDRYPDEIENLKSLFQVAKQTEPMLTVGFITRLGVPDNQVVLSTRHSAKGLVHHFVNECANIKRLFRPFCISSDRPPVES